MTVCQFAMDLENKYCKYGGSHVGARDESHESEGSQALMFCFDIVFQESLASLLSIWSLCFALPTRFCVPEWHRKRVKSSAEEKETEKKNTISVLFFSFLVRL